MIFCRIAVVAIGASRVVAALVTRHSRTVHEEEPTSFERFGQAIGLSPQHIELLGQQYAKVEGDTDDIVQVACLTAEAVIGQEHVDTLPLNQTVVEENWSATCVAEPHCILAPVNATDVSRALQIITYFNTTFAVRSGGHSPNPGASSVGGRGILLDLQYLNAIGLSQDRSVAHVGPGARWGEVYNVLDASQAVVIGGRLPSVGVGGLMLGGGYFHLSDQFGLAADNLAAAEVVLANGTIVTASPESNRHLWWALKGGGPNYGIVTRYDLNTVPVYEVWGMTLAFSLDQWDDAYAAFHQWQTVGAKDAKSSAAITASLTSITISLMYSEPADAPDAFAPFFDLGGMPVVGPLNTTLAMVAELLGTISASSAKRHDYRGCSSLIDANLTSSVYAFWRERALEVNEATGAVQTFTIQHVAASLVDYGNQRGGNPLGLPTGTDLQWWTTLIDWDDAASDDTVHAVSAETTALWAELGASRGSAVDFVYLNDASRDQNPLASYGAENLSRLRAISREYDPEQVFQKLQNGGFLLSRA
ncbi:hypothetical protein CKAH01_08671 [Colletotrichum kahawae]|uniref:FAD-binding PCMH-type domain-containing protein n=1 Tax=Colletotrichum kahawae TaxID=34407 RepID=A0AAD9Y0W7_COLKA|nr:hypothetical protein CKAH01_08671 [Colletotrichum kahawae]